jgi:hypothetical protein
MQNTERGKSERRIVMQKHISRRGFLSRAVVASVAAGVLSIVPSSVFGADPPSEKVKAVDAFVPKQWAQGGRAILEENMVVANLVHRDFEDDKVRALADVVNKRWPDMGPPLT